MLINARNLNVEIHGPAHGPAVILLHHGLGSTHAWKGQTAFLTAEGWRVIVYDRWGYGKSDPRPCLSVPDFSDDLADLQALMDELNLGRASLVGHSDGGTIGLYFAAYHPERVDCLATVAAHVYVEPKMEPGIEAIRAAYEGDALFQKAFRRVHGAKSEAVFSN
jgi:pimeloyl-ACP methyl ester carboxylesterase